MDLQQIIDTYKGKLAQNVEEATLFILKEMQQGELAQVLNRRYLLLVMCNGGGDGYDPITKRLYEVDPNVESLDFKPRAEQWVFFQKKDKHNGPETTHLREQEKVPLVQRLQVIGVEPTEEVLDAYVYNPKQKLETELIQDYYSGVVRQAEMLKARARTTDF